MGILLWIASINGNVGMMWLIKLGVLSVGLCFSHSVSCLMACHSEEEDRDSTLELSGKCIQWNVKMQL